MVKLGAIPATRAGAPAFRIRDMSDSPIILSVDPGVTTGWSILIVHPQSLVDPGMKVLGTIEHWMHGQIATAKHLDGFQREIFDGEGRLEYTDLGAEQVFAECKAADEILEIFDNFPGAAMLIEDFIPQKLDKERDFLSPIRMTSKIDYGMYQRGFQSFRQMPSEATGTVTNQRLQDWGFWERDGMTHARDADRHGIMWLRKCKTKKSLREACWPHLYGKYEVLDKVATARAQAERKGAPAVYRTEFGPYYIPPGMTWADVVEREQKLQEQGSAAAE